MLEISLVSFMNMVSFKVAFKYAIGMSTELMSPCRYLFMDSNMNTELMWR